MPEYFRLVTDYNALDIYVKQTNYLSRKLTIKRGFPIIKPPELPFTFSVDLGGENNNIHLPSFIEDGPTISEVIVEKMQQSGVDNIEVFDATFVNALSGATIPSKHKAVNVIGRVSCADLAQSKSEPIAGSQFFYELKISEEHAKGLLIFRLEEQPLEIICHSKIAKIFREYCDRYQLEPV